MGSPGTHKPWVYNQKLLSWDNKINLLSNDQDCQHWMVLVVMCHRACIWVYNSELVLDKSSKQIKSLTTRSYTILGYLGQCTLASWYTRPCPLGTLQCAPGCKASISCPFTGKTLPIFTSSSLFSLYFSLFFLCSCPQRMVSPLPYSLFF